jgi:hypothetical protein
MSVCLISFVDLIGENFTYYTKVLITPICRICIAVAHNPLPLCLFYTVPLIGYECVCILPLVLTKEIQYQAYCQKEMQNYNKSHGTFKVHIQHYNRTQHFTEPITVDLKETAR